MSFSVVVVRYNLYLKVDHDVYLPPLICTLAGSMDWGGLWSSIRLKLLYVLQRLADASNRAISTAIIWDYMYQKKLRWERVNTTHMVSYYRQVHKAQALVFLLAPLTTHRHNNAGRLKSSTVIHCLTFMLCQLP